MTDVVLKDGKYFVPVQEGDVLLRGSMFFWEKKQDDGPRTTDWKYEATYPDAVGHMDSYGRLFREVKPGDRVFVSDGDTKKGKTYEWESDEDKPGAVRFVRFVAPFDSYYFTYKDTGKTYWIVEAEPEPWEVLTEKPMLASVELKDPSRDVESFVLTGTWFREDNRVECEQLRAVAFDKEWVVDVEVIDE